MRRLEGCAAAAVRRLLFELAVFSKLLDAPKSLSDFGKREAAHLGGLSCALRLSRHALLLNSMLDSRTLRRRAQEHILKLDAADVPPRSFHAKRPAGAGRADSGDAADGEARGASHRIDGGEIKDE